MRARLWNATVRTNLHSPQEKLAPGYDLSWSLNRSRTGMILRCKVDLKEWGITNERCDCSDIRTMIQCETFVICVGSLHGLSNAITFTSLNFRYL